MQKNLLARVTAAFVVFSACASAQSQSPGKFSLPRGTLLCKQTAVTPSDSADVILDFTEWPDSGGERNALAAFDSTGRPLYMLVFIRQASTKNWSDAFAVGFHPFSSGGRIPMPAGDERVPFSVRPADSADAKTSAQQELTKSEIDEARVLAQWYWAHRCKNSSSL